MLDASLQIFFGRALDFGHGSSVDASLDNLPRVITSRSLDKPTSRGHIMSRRKVKVSTVEIAIGTLLDAETEDVKEQKERDKEKLAKFLERPFLREFEWDYRCTVRKRLLPNLLKYMYLIVMLLLSGSKQ